jgi:hypothetical protein
MRSSSRVARILSAVFATAVATTIFAGAALAHPESEGDHAGGCIVTVEPGTVSVGGTFTVEGNFGGASIFIVPGSGSMGEGAEPDATTPQGSSFSVEFTALGAGTYTVWGLIEGSECGDSDTLVVNAAPLPDTALEAPATSPLAALIGLLLVAVSMVAAVIRSAAVRR